MTDAKKYAKMLDPGNSIDEEAEDEPEFTDEELESLGRQVRDAWITWALTQPAPKPEWLIPWEHMEERFREVDRQIGAAIARDIREENRIESEREQAARNRAVESAVMWKDRAMRPRSQTGAWALLFLTLATLVLVLWTQQSIPAPAVCPTPVACPEAPPAAGPPAAISAEADGFWVELNDGSYETRPWPDASRYPAEQFTADCSAVCTVERTGTGAPGRVLVIDPAHLVCVCFHESGFRPVERWINWERVD